MKDRMKFTTTAGID